MKSSGALVILIGLVVATAAGAEADGPPSLGVDRDGNNFLLIPGVGRIPLPPGARGFGPIDPAEPGEGAAPRRMAPRTAMPPPEPPLSPEERRAQEMNRLFARLAAAEDAREAQSISAAIRSRWSRSDSDTTDLLAARALAAEAGGAPALAKVLLDYVVALSPRWSEAFVRRARVLASQGDVAGAMADLETAAQLEPKRFDALEALGALADKAGDKKRALDSYRKALEISPRDEGIQKNAERLRVEVDGRDI